MDVRGDVKTEAESITNVEGSGNAVSTSSGTVNSGNKDRSINVPVSVGYKNKTDGRRRVK